MPTTKVRQLPNGDCVVDIDQSFLDTIGVKEGDFIEWSIGPNKEASFRKFTGLEMQTAVGMGRMNFVVPAPNTRDGVLIKFQDSDGKQVSVIANMYEVRSLLDTLRILENQLNLITEVKSV